MCTKENLLRALDGISSDYVETMLKLSELRKAVNQIDSKELESDIRRMRPYLKENGNIVLTYKNKPLILTWFDWKDLEILTQLPNPLTRVLDFMDIRFDDTRDRGGLLRIFGTEDELYEVVVFCQTLFPGMIGGKYSTGTLISDGRPFCPTRTHKV